MNLYPQPTGPLTHRLWIEEEEFELAALWALQSVRLYPDQPGPVDIELFAETYFACGYGFEKLPADVRGQITFGPHGPAAITLHERLATLDDPRTIQMARSTLAHECSHGIFHSRLFQSCRRNAHEDPVLADRSSTLDKMPVAVSLSWMEYQAQRGMASLLMPAEHVITRLWALEAIPSLLPSMPQRQRAHIIDDLSRTFEVSPAVAQYRLNDMLEKVAPRVTQCRRNNVRFDPAALRFCWPEHLFARRSQVAA